MLGNNKSNAWNPQQYGIYQTYRSRPAQDLVNALPDIDCRNIVDLGCGPGNITALLRKLYPEASILGLDNSKPMLEKAIETYPNDTWVEQDIRNLSGDYDLVFSNAALQWLPDHKNLFPSIFCCVRPGGCMAVQMPRNADLLSHQALTETIEDLLESFPELQQHIRRNPVGTPLEYHNIFRGLGAESDIWETTYLHELFGDNPVLEWVKGSALSPVRGTLSQKAYQDFEDKYSEKLREYYPKLSNGVTLFPFKRIFMIAKKLR